MPFPLFPSPAESGDPWPLPSETSTSSSAELSLPWRGREGALPGAGHEMNYSPVGVPNTGALGKHKFLRCSWAGPRPGPHQCPPLGWPAALKVKVTVGERGGRTGRQQPPSAVLGTSTLPLPETLKLCQAVGHKLCVQGGSQSCRRGMGSLPDPWRRDPVGRAFPGLHGHPGPRCEAICGIPQAAASLPPPAGAALVPTVPRPQPGLACCRESLC